MSSAALSFEDGVTIAVLPCHHARAELSHQFQATLAAKEQMTVWLLASPCPSGRQGVQRCPCKSSAATASPFLAAQAGFLIADGQNPKVLCFAFGPAALLQLLPSSHDHTQELIPPPRLWVKEVLLINDLFIPWA